MSLGRDANREERTRVSLLSIKSCSSFHFHVDTNWKTKNTQERSIPGSYSALFTLYISTLLLAESFLHSKHFLFTRMMKCKNKNERKMNFESLDTMVKTLDKFSPNFIYKNYFIPKTEIPRSIHCPLLFYHQNNEIHPYPIWKFSKVNILIMVPFVQWIEWIHSLFRTEALQLKQNINWIFPIDLTSLNHT
jgi:hypothetical protein